MQQVAHRIDGPPHALRRFYDAAGIKLQEKVYEGGVLAKKTDYVGAFIYVNDTLQLIQASLAIATWLGVSSEL